MLARLLRQLLAHKATAATGGPDDKVTLAASREQGNADAALESLNAALRHDPACAEAYFKRAAIRRQRRQFAAALADYELALSYAPHMVGALVNKSLVYHQFGEFEKALDCLDRALALNPGLPVTWNNQGLMQRELGNLDAAERALQRALELQPDYPDAECNLALVLIDRREFDAALAIANRVLGRLPEHIEAHWLQALVHLLRGHFRDGWRWYESRLKRHDAYARPFGFPLWDGSELAQGRLLIYGEQGLGDDILFASCIADAMQRAPGCVIECERKLEGLFRRSFPAAAVYGTKHDSMPEWLEREQGIMCQIPMGSLPQYFRNDWPDFPRHAGYLRADSEKAAAWRLRLAQLGPGLKVGISWTGGALKTRRRLRSLGPEHVAALVNVPGIHLISLQYVDSEADIAMLKQRHGIVVHHWPDAIADYDETAALVAALDIVITVCTAIVHLAGALGKPAWVLAPASPEWRYLSEGTTMPWYPSVRLFRQESPAEWQPVIAMVRERLSMQIANTHGK